MKTLVYVRKIIDGIELDGFELRFGNKHNNYHYGWSDKNVKVFSASWGNINSEDGEWWYWDGNDCKRAKYGIPMTKLSKKIFEAMKKEGLIGSAEKMEHDNMIRRIKMEAYEGFQKQVRDLGIDI